jgi:hypothetical protein
MKKIFSFIVLFALVFQPGLGVAPSMAAQGSQGTEAVSLQTSAASEGPTMPGWPVPSQPIPHHEPGQPFRGGNATAQVTQMNAQGVEETTQLRGTDAMLANGTMTDPLQGNYKLVELDKVMFSSYTRDTHIFSVQSFKFVTPTLESISNSDISYGNMRFNAIAAGDLNGDLVDEQITSWVNPSDELIRIAIGELPGSFGKVTSTPGVVAYPDGSLDVVVRGYNQSLWHAHFDGAAWGDWDNDAGGVLLSSPAIASRAPGQMDVFAVGTDNQVYHIQWNGLNWGAWAKVDGGGYFPELERVASLPEVPAPAVVASGSAQLDLFRLGPDNTLWWCHSNDGVTWGAWQNLGGMLTSGPGAVSLGGGRTQVYALGVDGALWYRTYSANNWDAWQRLVTPDGVAGNAVPVLTSPAAGQVAVYLAGTEERIWKNQNNGSDWGSWSSIVVGAVQGAKLGAGIAAANGPSGAYLFAQMTDGSLQYSLNASGWTSQAGLSTSPVVITTNAQTKPLQSFDAEEYNNPFLDLTTGYFSGDGRQQVVLAYDGADDNLRLEIYDIHDGFRLRKTAEITPTIPGTYSPRVAAGDVNGDGVDEIGLVYVYDSNKYIGLSVYSIEKDLQGNWTLTETYRSAPVYLDNYNFAGTLRIAAGDIVPEADPLSRADEFSVVVNGIIYYENIGWRQLEAKLFLYDPDAKDPFSIIKESGPIGAGAESNHYISATGVGLAVGNVLPSTNVISSTYDTDEIVVIWPRQFSSNTYAFLRRDLIVLSRNSDGNFNETTYQFPCYSNHSALDTLAIGDLDQDMENEIVVVELAEGGCSAPLGFHMDVFKPESLTSGPITPSYSLSYGAAPRAFNLALGDFTGESIRVGPPTYRVQSKMVSPEVFLNLPPMHRDIIKVNGTNEEIKISNGADATYSAANTQSEQSTSESKREWSLSTGLEMSVGGGGSKVKTSLDNTYGKNFSKSTTDITAKSFEDTTKADYYDQVIYNSTNYAVWEYPVYGVQENSQDGPPTISVVFPLANITNHPDTTQGRLCDENFYAPSHQTYNVWSYEPIAGAASFGDFGSSIDSKSTTGGTQISVGMSAVNEASRSNSFHDQISAGLEYSYENSFKIPLIGSAWDFSFRAYAKGSYGSESISTLSTKFTQQSNVQVNIPSNPDPSIYTTVAYLYWAKAGYLVLDYQTQPQDSGAWQLYTLSDPAFILPWIGFPDPATGQFPAPPDPDAPPCGIDKQLFTHDIQVKPAYAQNGDTVTITATVHNFSNVNPPSPVTVGFYLGYPAGNNNIGSCTVPASNLDRDNGPQQCHYDWTVTGSAGEEKIYAVIDPGNALDEMHDEDDVINNNIGYGLLQVANADYFDPGLRQFQAYQSIPFEEQPGLGYDLYLPTTNITDTFRYELLPTALGHLSSVGKPIQVLAFGGGQKYPDAAHTFAPTPAALVAFYRDADLLPGMDEADLKLYRLVGFNWVEATCPGYETVRFPEDNRLAVPICQTGTFVLAASAPTAPLYLPLVFRR